KVSSIAVTVYWSSFRETTVKQTPLCDTLWSTFSSEVMLEDRVRCRLPPSFSSFSTFPKVSMIPVNLGIINCLVLYCKSSHYGNDFMEENQKIRLGISIGDINGIGCEVVLKTFEDARMLDFCTPIIFASNKTISQQKNDLGIDITFNGVRDASQ